MSPNDLLKDQKGRRKLAPLEERFLKYGLKGFSGPEMIELLLCPSLPRKDCKKVVGVVVAKYKTLGEFLAAPTEELEKIPGMTPSSILFIKLMRELPEVFLKEKIIHKPIHHSSQEIFDYLYQSIPDVHCRLYISHSTLVLLYILQNRLLTLGGGNQPNYNIKPPGLPLGGSFI